MLLVMLGAAVGAPSRWLLDQAIQRRHSSVYPWGTWTINILGSLILGVILGAAATGAESTRLVALAGTGFCGGFTTFSTFGYETVILAEEESRWAGAVNVAVSLAVGLLAATGGWYLSQALWG
jgi:CrcB protein